jgi:hypothetical protein
MATGYGLDGHDVQTGSVLHPASYAVGNGDSFPGIKGKWHEADHSPPANAKVKKKLFCTCTPSHVVAWCWDNCLFTVLPYLKSFLIVVYFRQLEHLRYQGYLMSLNSHVMADTHKSQKNTIRAQSQKYELADK